MPSVLTSTFSLWIASTLVLQPASVFAHVTHKRADSCPSTIERDVIVVGGGSGGT
jgi:hypothetical protein